MVLLAILEESNFGDMTLIDLRGLNKEAWETDPRLSLARGIAALRQSPRPIWFVQLANQHVDDWRLPYDRPIFTQYSQKQFGWMFEASLSSDWPDAYAERCRLVMPAELMQKCRGTKPVGH
jgi:hypothetical protein